MIKYLHVLINAVLKYQSMIFYIIPLKRMVIPCTLSGTLTQTIFHLSKNNQNSKVYFGGIHGQREPGGAASPVITKSHTQMSDYHYT